MSSRKAQRTPSNGWLGFSRIIVVTHRLPVSVEKVDSDFNINEIIRLKGVVAAVSNMKRESREVLWIGSVPSLAQYDEVQQLHAIEKLNSQNYYPVIIDTETNKKYFTNFCKGVLWPLFHYYGEADIVPFQEMDWEAYCTVNRYFADTIEKVYKLGDIVLVQDYQLLLVPNMLREKIRQAHIGLYFQIPWPSSEIYRRLTVRNSILRGMLGADLIAFQTFSFARHFFSACVQILGLRISHDMSGVEVNGQFIKVEVIPTGIDTRGYIEILTSKEFERKKKEIKKNFAGKTLIVSQDRIEIKSGLMLKLNAFKKFLQVYPEYRESVVLFQACTTNNDCMESQKYIKMVDDLEELIGSINGQYSTINHTPIIYSKQRQSIQDILAVFSCAGAGLITPTRDGMNLVSHEFIVSQFNSPLPAPLILSEFTGASKLINNAIIVNPWDEEEMVAAIHEALVMSPEEKVLRQTANIEYVRSNSARHWIISLLREITMSDRYSTVNFEHHVLNIEEVMSAYWKADQKLFFIDYDSCISHSHKSTPPTKELLEQLEVLSEDYTNSIYLFSGQTRQLLEKWFGDLHVGLIAEYGAFLRNIPSSEGTVQWQNKLTEHDFTWRETAEKWVHDIQESTPGSVIDRKEATIAIHFPKTNNGDGYDDKSKNAILMYLHGTPKLPVIPITYSCEQYDTVVIAPEGITNLTILKEVLAENYEFVFCLGNDRTDEEIFNQLEKHNPPALFTVTMKEKQSSAKYYLKNQYDLQKLLSSFINKPLREKSRSCLIS